MSGNMKTVLIAVLSLVALVGTAAETKTQAKKPATGWAAKIEQTVEAMMPTQKVDRMVGFFAPVVKKYMPTFQQFQTEYQTATKKLPVIEKYLPKADAAVAEAKAMTVPEKYVAQKEQYIGEVETLLSMVRMSTSLARRLSGGQATP